MKKPTFLHGIAVAAVFAFVTGVVFAAMTPLLGSDNALRLVVPAIGLAYLLYLLSASGQRVGRITTLIAWSVLTMITWWATPSLVFYLLIHVGAIWLVRSLYFCSGIAPALIDLGLTAVSVCTAIWALGQSHSIFLATWCFFLVQALYVAIPPRIGSRTRPGVHSDVDDMAFEQARRQAEAALRQMVRR